MSKGVNDSSRVGRSESSLMNGLVDKLSTRISSRDGGSEAAHNLQRAMERGTSILVEFLAYLE